MNKNLNRLIKSIDGIDCRLSIVGLLNSDQLKILKNNNVTPNGNPKPVVNNGWKTGSKIGIPIRPRPEKFKFEKSSYQNLPIANRTPYELQPTSSHTR